MDHYCNGQSSCKGGLISAIPINMINVICGGIQGCDNMDIHTPININYISNINITTVTTSTHIYSIHGLTNLDIYCDGDCDENNDAYIIYGGFYESVVCPIYDSLCIKSVRINSIAFQSDDDLDIKYNSDGDYTNLVLNKNRILLFLLHPLHNITSNTIQSAPSTTLIHVICVDNAYHPSCNNINFDFRASSVVLITANNAHSIS